MITSKRKRGRPLLRPKGSTKNICIRVTESTKADWMRKAFKSGKSLTAWIESKCESGK